jgi:hypothetical protein
MEQNSRQIPKICPRQTTQPLGGEYDFSNGELIEGLNDETKVSEIEHWLRTRQPSFRHSNLIRHSSFVIRHSSPSYSHHVFGVSHTVTLASFPFNCGFSIR